MPVCACALYNPSSISPLQSDQLFAKRLKTDGVFLYSLLLLLFFFLIKVKPILAILQF